MRLGYRPTISVLKNIGIYKFLVDVFSYNIHEDCAGVHKITPWYILRVKYCTKNMFMVLLYNGLCSYSIWVYVVCVAIKFNEKIDLKSYRKVR